ncbi:hypothetical protein ACFV4X_36590 [Streptomyces ardesiacus]|uniref:hypothetical protein n=1 Tax=Streptomyces ardesiacus TaxID=285564 RepID=UPI00364D1240
MPHRCSWERCPAAAGSLPAPAAQAAPPLPTFRADTDRDGLVTADDDAREDEWSRERGALMLPDVDDDQQRCPTAGAEGSRLSDDSLAACDDSADDVVNRRGGAVTTGHAG